MNFNLFDAHCDTLQKICDHGGELKKNNYQLDISRIKRRSSGSVQVFAAFIDKKNDKLPPFSRCMQLISRYKSELKKNKETMHHCSNVNDIKTALETGKVASLLSIEGGEALEGNIENLIRFYDLGVRIITLCWNYRNEIADGITEPEGLGLTDFGKLLIKEMNRVGVLIDVSHISEKGFWDIIENSRTPIAATHSNVKALKNHPRNLSDEQIKAIIKNNGCIGINIYPEFVKIGGCDSTDIVRHIEYIMSLGGENNIGIGSDFDGIEVLPYDICSAEELEKIPNELLRLGYSEKLVENVLYNNFFRVFETVIK